VEVWHRSIRGTLNGPGQSRAIVEYTPHLQQVPHPAGACCPEQRGSAGFRSHLPPYAASVTFSYSTGTHNGIAPHPLYRCRNTCPRTIRTGRNSYIDI
jgi:hypothetical protein